jgi:hypothetical protein
VQPILLRYSRRSPSATETGLSEPSSFNAMRTCTGYQQRRFRGPQGAGPWGTRCSVHPGGNAETVTATHFSRVSDCTTSLRAGFADALSGNAGLVTGCWKRRLWSATRQRVLQKR